MSAGEEVWEMMDRGNEGERSPMVVNGEAFDNTRPVVRSAEAGTSDRTRHLGSDIRLANPNMTGRTLANGPTTVGSTSPGDDVPDHADSERGLVVLGSTHNRYATRKTAAQGMMDMALMLANASQLKSVVQEGRSHEHYTLLIFLISLSITLQVFTGIVLLVVGARESNHEDSDEKRNKQTNKLNNFSVALVFLITVTNIFITSFGINGNTWPMSSSGHGTGEINGVHTGTGTGSGSETGFRAGLDVTTGAPTETGT